MCVDLTDAEPGERLRTLAALRADCDRVLGRALVEAMTHARTRGWALRRIADVADHSHEHVRHLLARALPAPDQDGPRP